MEFNDKNNKGHQVKFLDLVSEVNMLNFLDCIYDVFGKEPEMHDFFSAHLFSNVRYDHVFTCTEYNYKKAQYYNYDKFKIFASQPRIYIAFEDTQIYVFKERLEKWSPKELGFT